MSIDKYGIKLSTSYITKVFVIEMSLELFKRSYTHISFTDFELIMDTKFLHHIFEKLKATKERFLTINSTIKTIFMDDFLKRFFKIQHYLTSIVTTRTTSDLFSFYESHTEISLCENLKCGRYTRNSTSDNYYISLRMGTQWRIWISLLSMFEPR